MKTITKKLKFDLTAEEIINEITYHYHSSDINKKYGVDIYNCDNAELLYVFNDVITGLAEKTEIQNLTVDHENSKVLIDTPDGFCDVSNYYIKKDLQCYEIKTKNHSCKSSYLHKYEINVENNWVSITDIKINDKILTKTGWENVTEINDIGKSDTYDFTVLHENSRYWGGSGISSHNCGKSFLCFNMAVQAQAAGYAVIYIDTEFAIELDQLPGYGIDVSEGKFMLLRNNVIEDLKVFMTQLLDSLKMEKQSGKEIQKFIIFLDSVGQLGSRKEIEDALAGKEKADFTKAKALASFFRIISSDLGFLKIPMVCTNHTYKTMDLFPQDKMKGGCLVADNVIQTRDGLKYIQDIQVGDYVLTLDGFDEVLDTHVMDKEIVEFEFNIGLKTPLKIRCSKQHKFLVSNDFIVEQSWKTANELNINDEILSDLFSKLKIVKKTELNSIQKVYDLTIANSHHYIDENGIVHHNSGLFYSASSIAFLSKAKLKEGDVDDLDLGQSGIVVTAKMVKNRMAKPKKVKFEISFVSGCNPYVGLDFWCDENTFDQVGIAKGKFDEKTKTFIPGGVRWYVGHLGKHVATAKLFSPEVFTKDVLDNLRPIIKDYFKYKSITELNELNRRLEDAKGELTDKELYGDDITSEKLFNDDED